MARTRRWNPLLHPRDRNGRFIKVGQLVQWFTEQGDTNYGRVRGFLEDDIVGVDGLDGNEYLVAADRLSIPTGQGPKPIDRVRDRVMALRARLPKDLSQVGVLITNLPSVDEIREKAKHREPFLSKKMTVDEYAKRQADLQSILDKLEKPVMPVRAVPVPERTLDVWYRVHGARIVSNVLESPLYGDMYHNSYDIETDSYSFRATEEDAQKWRIRRRELEQQTRELAEASPDGYSREPFEMVLLDKLLSGYDEQGGQPPYSGPVPPSEYLRLHGLTKEEATLITNELSGIMRGQNAYRNGIQFGSELPANPNTLTPDYVRSQIMGRIALFAEEHKRLASEYEWSLTEHAEVVHHQNKDGILDISDGDFGPGETLMGHLDTVLKMGDQVEQEVMDRMASKGFLPYLPGTPVQLSEARTKIETLISRLNVVREKALAKYASDHYDWTKQLAASHPHPIFIVKHATDDDLPYLHDLGVYRMWLNDPLVNDFLERDWNSLDVDEQQIVANYQWASILRDGLRERYGIDLLTQDWSEAPNYGLPEWTVLSNEERFLIHKYVPREVSTRIDKLQRQGAEQMKRLDTYSDDYLKARSETYREVLADLGVSFGPPKGRPSPYYLQEEVDPDAFDRLQDKVRAGEPPTSEEIPLDRLYVGIGIFSRSGASVIGPYTGSYEVGPDAGMPGMSTVLQAGAHGKRRAWVVRLEEDTEWNGVVYPAGTEAVVPLVHVKWKGELSEDVRRSLHDGLQNMPTHLIEQVWDDAPDTGIPVWYQNRASRHLNGVGLPDRYNPGTVSTVIHEEHHAVENSNPWIRAMEWSLLSMLAYDGEPGSRRAKKGVSPGKKIPKYQQAKLKRIYSNSGYKDHEVAIQDDLPDAYMGKLYARNGWGETGLGGANSMRSNYELLTMSAEATLWHSRSDLGISENVAGVGRLTRQFYTGTVLASHLAAEADADRAPDEMPGRLVSPAVDSARDLPKSIQTTIEKILSVPPALRPTYQVSREGDKVTLRITSPRIEGHFQATYKLQPGRVPKALQVIHQKPDGSTEKVQPTKLVTEVEAWLNSAA